MTGSAKRKGDARIARVARAQLQYAVRTGRITRLGCEVCGMPDAEGHHDDYNRPLDVRWLCRQHHSDVHHDLIVATRARGERNGQARLTDQQVDEIRSRHKVVHPGRKTGCSSTELAREFGITRQYVTQLVSRMWRNG